MRNVALLAVMVVLGALTWAAFRSSDVSVVVNGHRLLWPSGIGADTWGVVVATVAFFCAATLLALAFAGIGLVLLGALVGTGLLGAWLAFPFLWPLLVSLFLVWIFVAVLRRPNKSSGSDRSAA